MKQRVSELMDSELDARRAAEVIAAIEADASLKQDWNDYHLIGDAMRANSRLGVDVAAVVSARLKDEPTVLAPRRWLRPMPRVNTVGAAALAASVGFAAVIAWQQLPGVGHSAQMVASVAAPSSALPAGGTADAYFLAHQEMAADQGLVKASYQQEAARR